MTSPTKGTGLAQNLANALCYIVMPVSSIIMMLLEEDNKEVQYHAWQGTAFGVGCILLTALIYIVSAIFGQIWTFLGIIVSLLIFPVFLGAFIIWFVSLIKAYQGERWRIPFIAEFADKKSGASSGPAL